MITDRKTEAKKAAAPKAANKQAARKRVIARIDAYDEKLTNTARQHLYDSVQEIKSEYDAAIHAALEQAESEASESLRNLAGQFGWSLVQAAAEDDYIMFDYSVPKTVLDMVWFDEEKEFQELEACVESANTLYPDTEAQTVGNRQRRPHVNRALTRPDVTQIREINTCH
jgi:predicted Zn-dependent protease